MESTTRKVGANADRGIIQTKTFFFPIEDAETLQSAEYTNFVGLVERLENYIS